MNFEFFFHSSLNFIPTETLLRRSSIHTVTASLPLREFLAITPDSYVVEIVSVLVKRAQAARVLVKGGHNGTRKDTFSKCLDVSAPVDDAKADEADPPPWHHSRHAHQRSRLRYGTNFSTEPPRQLIVRARAAKVCTDQPSSPTCSYRPSHFPRLGSEHYRSLARCGL